MSDSLIECVPNFSEGRRPEVVDRLRQTIAAVPGVAVLDVHTDADHNRSVITFAGPPLAVSEAAFAAIGLAAREINLEVHRGEHPRIGATDVVPFVPISGTTLEACVELARTLGQRVGTELGIPVYLYEAAATRPERVNLENLRRGEYEGLRTAIETDPERAPDFGPARLGPAGATVIGARVPLIAFNIYLTTSDVSIAKKVARAIRTSSGGLPYVKALGMEVDGRAQVSMNLTDSTRTSLPTVVEAVRSEARKHGVDIERSELVGLLPQQAMIDAAARYLKLEPFDASQILETRLAGIRPADFLDQLAAATPTPGGGAAAAQAGAMAAALTAMVARLSMGKKRFEAIEPRMREIAAEADDLRRRLTDARDRDSAAFEAVLEAMRLPREGEAEKAARASAIEQATLAAALVPQEVAIDAARAAELAAEAAETGNPNAVSDAASAVALARAALQAAAWNVRINAQSLRDASAVPEWTRRLEEAARRMQAAEQRAEAALKARAGLGG